MKWFSQKKLQKRKKAFFQKAPQSSLFDQNLMISKDYKENEQRFRMVFQNCTDVIYRFLQITKEQQGFVIYVDGLVDTRLLDLAIIKPLLYDSQAGHGEDDKIERILQENDIANASLKSETNFDQVVQHILKGFVALIFDGQEKAMLIELKGYPTRSVDEPLSEPTIRGSREGFIEDLRMNTSMIRRRLCTPNLKIESLRIGEISQTNIAVAYIEGIVNKDILAEVKRRLSSIQIDIVMESSYIEEFIEDLPFSPFPQIQNTERPDVVAANLAEGKVAIFVDCTPFVLIVPMLFWGSMTVNEDYYERSMVMTGIRWIRYLSLFMALFFPSLFIAITTYHHEMLPTNLMLSIAAAREFTPFPVLVEALIMEVAFEALREAGVRLPRPVGQAVSIVGALVIGQAAVEAGIVSAPSVIVVSMTGIASFTIPHFNFALGIRMIRFPLMILAGTLGFYGIILGALIILIHLCSLRTFGVPYFTPIGPTIGDSLKDVFIRVPWWAMNKRPGGIGPQDAVRVPKGQRPKPSRDNQ